MADIDDKFPTRTGEAIGSPLEARMAKSAGGTDGIKTQRWVMPDGGTARLHTRLGHPDFYYEPAEEEDESVRCAAIPVSNTGKWGFDKENETFTPLSYGSETSPASAEMRVRKAGLSFSYNKFSVTNSGSASGKIHPGNRSWLDTRGDRTTARIVSWWSPFLTGLELPFSWWADTPPWIGNSGVMRQRIARPDTTDPILDGTWESCRGFVFMSGRKVCDFSHHVWAACFDSANNRILAVTTEFIRHSSDGIDTTDFNLVQYDLTTDTYSHLYNLGGAWSSCTSREPMPSFSPSAEALLIALYFGPNYDPTIYSVPISTGVKQEIRVVNIDTFGTGGHWDLDRVITMRYSDDGASIKYGIERTLQPATGYNGFELEIEGDVVASNTGHYYVDGSSVVRWRLEGDLARIVACDWRGNYIVAFQSDFLAYGWQNQFDSGDAYEEMSHVGAAYMQYASPPYPPEDMGLRRPGYTTVDLPLFFARAGESAASWASIPEAYLGQNYDGGWVSFPPTMNNYRVNANSNITDYGTPSQRELQTILCTSPSGDISIVGARMEGGYTHEVAISGGTDVYGVYQSFSKIFVMSSDGAAPQGFLWGGDYKWINSPIWFLR